MPSKNSIAILPFLNISPDPENEYFSDGITEEIINALCRFEVLQVTSRTSSFSFKKQHIDIREIGRKLGVYYLLEGSIRRSGEKVRITAQLIKAEDGFHLWSESWNRELKDIFILQDEIANLIAGRINSKIKPVELNSETVIENTLALDHYLKGQHLLNNFVVIKKNEMLAHYEKAIALDPDFEKAYMGLCNAYTWLSSVGAFDPTEANRKVEDNLKILMRLNPNTPEIYLLIAGKNYWIDWDMQLAYENISRSIELKPGEANSYVQKGLIFMVTGALDEAFEALYHAQRLNPYDEVTDYLTGFLFSLINENDKAMERVSKSYQTLSLWDAHFFLSVETLCKLGRFDEAWDIICKKEKRENFEYLIPYIKGLYYSIKGEPDKTSNEIAQLESILDANPQPGMPFYYYMSKVYVYLGNKAKALYYFEKSLQFKSTPVLFAKIDCIFDGLRYDEIFQNILGKYKFEVNASASAKAKYKRSELSPELVNMIDNKINDLMKLQKPYLNPQLNSPDLAEMIDITTNQLSQFLNEHRNKNFYDYINSFRLQEFLRLSKAPGFKHLSILGLALESGFNSKTTFNGFFKREMGVTPSEYFKGK